jgi:hypothetical protein
VLYDDYDDNNDTWSFDVPWVDSSTERLHFPYSANDGLQVQSSNRNYCLKVKVYENYTDNRVIDITVRDMNRYTTQYIAKRVTTMKPGSCVHKWEGRDSQEIRILFAVLILQGVIHKPENNMYS